jgi:chemotaxis protein MotA
MSIANLLDPQSALIVLGGTIFATVLRSGRDELSATTYSILRLGRRFHLPTARSEVAGPVADMRKDGVLRAHFDKVSDPYMRKVIHGLVHDRSVVAMLEIHSQQRQQRSKKREKACRTLYQAGELGPVLGLAGTLISLGMMSAEEAAKGSITGSLSMAVLTTLYGVIAAHFLFLPLARAIERRGEVEEADRQELVAWMADQLADACPMMRQRRTADRPAIDNRGAPPGPGVMPLGRRA